MSWTVIWTTRTRGQLRVGTEMSCRWQRFKEMVWFMSYTLKTSTFQGNRIFCNSGNTVCLYLVVCYSDWPTVSRQTTFKSWCVREAELLIVYLNYHMWLPCWKSQKLTSSYTIYIENTWLFKLPNSWNRMELLLMHSIVQTSNKPVQIQNYWISQW